MATKGVGIMIRHILFWNYTDNVKAQHKEEETLKFLQNSVDTMNGHIDGLINATIGKNIAGGYDIVCRIKGCRSIKELPDTSASYGSQAKMCRTCDGQIMWRSCCGFIIIKIITLLFAAINEQF